VLYVVGGVARSGKSIVARQLLAKAGVPYFSLDFLLMGMALGLPQAGIDPEAPSDEIARRMWPVVRALSVNILEIGMDYLIEGDSVLPAQVQELALSFPGQVRPCFIGYPSVDAAAKVEAMRSHSALPNDWIGIYSPERILAFIQSMIRLSQEFQAQCSQTGIPFFDVSQDFTPTIEVVVAYLTTGQVHV